jgi:hypothetical protein
VGRTSSASVVSYSREIIRAAARSEKRAHVACFCIPPKDEKYSGQQSKEAGSEENGNLLAIVNIRIARCEVSGRRLVVHLRCRTTTGGIRKALLGILLGFGRAGVRFDGDFNLAPRL